MQVLIYCGTDAKVDEKNTQSLFAGEFNAIWYPTLYQPQAITPRVGDMIWLIWRKSNGDAPLILGYGFLIETPEGNLKWTHRTCPGVRDQARQLGYDGPDSMTFLRAARVRCFSGFPQCDLGVIRVGLNLAGIEQIETLFDHLIPQD